MVNEHDLRWNEVRETWGWKLPPPAFWLWRLPIIRHVRYLVGVFRVEAHARRWASIGRPASGYDHWVLYAIARGWC